MKALLHSPSFKAAITRRMRLHLKGTMRLARLWVAGAARSHPTHSVRINPASRAPILELRAPGNEILKGTSITPPPMDYGVMPYIARDTTADGYRQHHVRLRWILAGAVQRRMVLFRQSCAASPAWSLRLTTCMLEIYRLAQRSFNSAPAP